MLVRLRLLSLLGDWLTQERARRNAGQAAIRMMHRRNQWVDLEATRPAPLVPPEPPFQVEADDG